MPAQVDQIIDEMNRWGPWYLLVSGVGSLYLATILWGMNVRVSRWILNIGMLNRITERKEMPLPFRASWRWLRENYDKPIMRWFGAAWGIIATAGGLLWLKYR